MYVYIFVFVLLFCVHYTLYIINYIDAGQAYSSTNVAECIEIAIQETVLMRSYLEKLNEISRLYLNQNQNHISTHSPLTLSVGCTLTELARMDYTDVTEIRPGNYVFYDLTPHRIGLIDKHDISLSILATVVSINDIYALLGTVYRIEYI